jgi:UDPglucose 6-dehydrogenase
VDIYANWIPKEKILTTNVWSSELAKLASNAMLAQRISSINSLSALCEKTGANIDELSKAIGMDHRIGPHFLKASVGFGGSCFQKDILNLVYLCKYFGLEKVAEYWFQVIKINDYQKNRFAQKIIDAFQGDIQGKSISILGWAFKKDTNDSRESAAIYVAFKLLENGFSLKIYDPMVSKSKIYSDLDSLMKSRGLSQSNIEQQLNHCKVYNDFDLLTTEVSAIVILTEWDEFKYLPWKEILKKIRDIPLIFDGRNILTPKQFNNSTELISIGR